jgi:glycogen synthase
MKSLKTLSSILLLLLFIILAQASNISSKRVTIITVQGDKYTYHYTLKYDSQNRITTAIPDHAETFGITHFEYGANTFRISKGDIYVSGSLNEQGYIDIAEDGDFPVLLVGNMFYNDKGQLSSIENGNEKMLFTWKNDDMVQMNFQDEQINVTYTTFENKNQFGLFLKIDEDNCTPVFPYYTLLGKATQHLPASVGQGEQKISYQYKTDKDGFVTEIAMIYPDNGKTVFYRFAYD